MFNPYRDLYYRSFILGNYYQKDNKVYQFIWVTSKGFNLLDIKTYKCLFKQHIYSMDFRHKEIPKDIKVVHNCPILTSCVFKEVSYNVI